MLGLILPPEPEDGRPSICQVQGERQCGDSLARKGEIGKEFRERITHFLVGNNNWLLRVALVEFFE